MKKTTKCKFGISLTKRAFDEFKIRWIPPVPLVYPQPAGFFFLGVFADEKEPSGSACIDASRLIFQSAVSSQIRLVAKKQAGLTRLFRCIPAVKPSEFTERTLSYVELSYSEITFTKMIFLIPLQIKPVLQTPLL